MSDKDDRDELRLKYRGLNQARKMEPEIKKMLVEKGVDMDPYLAGVVMAALTQMMATDGEAKTVAQGSVEYFMNRLMTKGAFAPSREQLEEYLKETKKDGRDQDPDAE